MRRAGQQKKILDIDIVILPTHVRRIKWKIAKRIIEHNHYLGYAPCGCKFCLGIYADNELLGVMIFGHPIARMEDQKNTLELSRMFLFFSPKNSESKSLSLAEKWIRRNRPERRLIAYSDISEGHLGTIYRAANWTFCKNIPVGDWNSGGRKRRHGIIGGEKNKFERLL